jgi:hypothetical protein
MFGQIPDTLEDVWVKIAQNDEQAAQQLIERAASSRNPFDENTARWRMRIGEPATQVLDPIRVREIVSTPW